MSKTIYLDEGDCCLVFKADLSTEFYWDDEFNPDINIQVLSSLYINRFLLPLDERVEWYNEMIEELKASFEKPNDIIIKAERHLKLVKKETK